MGKRARELFGEVVKMGVIRFSEIFSISRRTDTEKEYVIGLFLVDLECYSIVLFDEYDFNNWMKALLAQRHGIDFSTGHMPKPHYMSMWTVKIRKKHGAVPILSGRYYLGLSKSEVSLIMPSEKSNDNIQYKFPFQVIRKYGFHNELFYIEFSNSIFGVGEMWMKFEDSATSVNVYCIITKVLNTSPRLECRDCFEIPSLPKRRTRHFKRSFLFFRRILTFGRGTQYSKNEDQYQFLIISKSRTFNRSSRSRSRRSRSVGIADIHPIQRMGCSQQFKGFTSERRCDNIPTYQSDSESKNTIGTMSFVPASSTSKHNLHHSLTTAGTLNAKSSLSTATACGSYDSAGTSFSVKVDVENWSENERHRRSSSIIDSDDFVECGGNNSVLTEDILQKSKSSTNSLLGSQSQCDFCSSNAESTKVPVKPGDNNKLNQVSLNSANCKDISRMDEEIHDDYILMGPQCSMDIELYKANLDNLPPGPSGVTMSSGTRSTDNRRPELNSSRVNFPSRPEEEDIDIRTITSQIVESESKPFCGQKLLKLKRTDDDLQTRKACSSTSKSLDAFNSEDDLVKMDFSVNKKNNIKSRSNSASSSIDVDETSHESSKSSSKFFGIPGMKRMFSSTTTPKPSNKNSGIFGGAFKKIMKNGHPSKKGGMSGEDHSTSEEDSLYDLSPSHNSMPGESPDVFGPHSSGFPISENKGSLDVTSKNSSAQSTNVVKLGTETDALKPILKCAPSHQNSVAGNSISEVPDGYVDMNFNKNATNRLIPSVESDQLTSAPRRSGPTVNHSISTQYLNSPDTRSGPTINHSISTQYLNSRPIISGPSRNHSIGGTQYLNSRPITSGPSRNHSIGGTQYLNSRPITSGPSRSIGTQYLNSRPITSGPSRYRSIRTQYLNFRPRSGPTINYSTSTQYLNSRRRSSGPTINHSTGGQYLDRPAPLLSSDPIRKKSVDCSEPRPKNITSTLTSSAASICASISSFGKKWKIFEGKKEKAKLPSSSDLQDSDYYVSINNSSSDDDALCTTDINDLIEQTLLHGSIKTKSLMDATHKILFDSDENLNASNNRHSRLKIKMNNCLEFPYVRRTSAISKHRTKQNQQKSNFNSTLAAVPKDMAVKNVSSNIERGSASSAAGTSRATGLSLNRTLDEEENPFVEWFPSAYRAPKNRQVPNNFAKLSLTRSTSAPSPAIVKNSYGSGLRKYSDLTRRDSCCLSGTLNKRSGPTIPAISHSNSKIVQVKNSAVESPISASLLTDLTVIRAPKIIIEYSPESDTPKVCINCGFNPAVYERPKPNTGQEFPTNPSDSALENRKIGNNPGESKLSPTENTSVSVQSKTENTSGSILEKNSDASRRGVTFNGTVETGPTELSIPHIAAENRQVENKSWTQNMFVKNNNSKPEEKNYNGSGMKPNVPTIRQVENYCPKLNLSRARSMSDPTLTIARNSLKIEYDFGFKVEKNSDKSNGIVTRGITKPTFTNQQVDNNAPNSKPSRIPRSTLIPTHITAKNNAKIERAPGSKLKKISDTSIECGLNGITDEEKPCMDQVAPASMKPSIYNGAFNTQSTSVPAHKIVKSASEIVEHSSESKFEKNSDKLRGSYYGGYRLNGTKISYSVPKNNAANSTPSLFRNTSVPTHRNAPRSNLEKSSDILRGDNIHSKRCLNVNVNGEMNPCMKRGDPTKLNISKNQQLNNVKSAVNKTSDFQTSKRLISSSSQIGTQNKIIGRHENNDKKNVP